MADHSATLAHMLAENIDCTGYAEDGSYELHLEIQTQVDFQGSSFVIEHDDGSTYTVSVSKLP